MIRHLIKLIWNKKRSNFLLTTEVFASFIVLFGVLSFIIYSFSNYAKPLGYEYERVWAANFDQQAMPDSLFAGAMQRALRQVRSYPQVEAAGLSSVNTPYSETTISYGLESEGKNVNSQVIIADESYPAVFDIRMVEGRWFQAGENVKGQRYAVINQQLREALFGGGPALGKYIGSDEENRYTVVGIIGNFKLGGEFQSPKPMAFFNSASREETPSAMVLKVKPGTDANFEAELLEELGGMAPGVNIGVSHLKDQRRNVHNLVKVPMIAASIVCGFLLLNVGLGLFGVLWYNIRRRREEIGLRRALGATGRGIRWQFVGEAMVIAALGAFIGLFFAIQLPLLNVFGLEKGIYLQAIGFSLLGLAALVALCALYPSILAARVQPARALHEE